MIIEAVRIFDDPGRIVDLHVDESGRLSAITGSAAQRSALVVLPAFVDLHTHLREPGGEDAESIESGTRAAVAGGFSDVFAMPNTEPATDDVDKVLRLRRAARHSRARVHPIAAATVGRAGRRLVDVEALRAHGVSVFSDDGSCLDDPALVEDLLRRLARLGGVFAQHAQSTALAGAGVANARVASRLGVVPWPEEAEETVIARDVALAEATGGHLHVCHVSTAGSVEIIRDAKRRGAPVTAEATPHHLVLTDELVSADDGRFKVNPPLRGPSDVEAVRRGLRDGTIDIVATDHAPHPAARKNRPLADAAFGFTALETALPIVAEVFEDAAGTVDWPAVARVMAHRPAEIGGIAGIAGRPVAVGEPATVTLIRTDDSRVVRGARHVSRSANTPFEDRVVRYSVEATWVDGQQVFRGSRERS
ncbi:dihydroorotase [Microbacterium resistens]|uniref:dihydroorotase n=1 Tax=Microbacterium resistens TaxID=156977 RepID=UPI001C56DE3D|nr:dihydroorotase [Microbacterium resistens]MBW1638699.1 dihydroorotase [Microbacterium resistens]